MFDFKNDYYLPLNDNLDQISESAENLIDGSHEADDIPRVIREAEKIIQQAEQIKVLAKERQKHPEVKAEFLWKTNETSTC